MNTLSIKKLFYISTVVLTFIFAVYVYITSDYIKSTTKELLNQKSINYAYFVAKEMTELTDKIVYSYHTNEDKLYDALSISQKYMLKHGHDANLSALKEILNSKTEDFTFDIYLINKKFIIYNTTFKADLGLDFHIIPLALKTIENSYKDKKLIDLSRISLDTITDEHKRYIIQHASRGEFLIQISMLSTLSKSVKNFADKIRIDIPNLLSTKVYMIPKINDDGYRVALQYSTEYAKFTKNEMLKKRDVYAEFVKSFFMTNDIDEKIFRKKIQDFFAKKQHKDYYYEKDSMYIHRVIMPFVTYANLSRDIKHILYIEFDESKAKQSIKYMNYFSIIIWIILISLIIFILMIVNKRIINPIEFIKINMKSKRSIDLKQLHSNSDEISSVSIAYNKLLETLKVEINSNEELLKQFKTFTANTIHQVRTPVSVIKIALEMIETDNKEAVLQIKSSLVSVEHMYDSLSYTLNKDSINFEKINVNLSKFLSQRVNLFSTIAKAHDIDIISEIDEDIFITINQIQLEYLIDNNISNALKYGQTKKDILVRLTKVAKDIRLSFDSYGEEIQDKEIIFERFHRQDKSRKGNGIGLHMVKDICKSNDILIKLEYVNSKNKFLYLIEV